VVWAGFDLPGPPLDVSPIPPPHGQLATVIGLQLRGVDHPEAAAGLNREGDDEVARLGHLTHTRAGLNMHALYVSIPVSIP
jgi:hypothetical protein